MGLEDTLTDIEVKALQRIGKKGEMSERELYDLGETRAKRALMWLSNKGLITLNFKPEVSFELTERGKEALEELPEEKVLRILKKEKKVEIKKLGLSKSEISIALGELKKKGIIKLEKGFVELLKEGKTDVMKALEKMRIEGLEALSENERDILLKRGILERKVRQVMFAKITDQGKEVLERLERVEYIDQLTPEVIRTGKWRGAKFRRYDLTSPVPKIFGGRKHPLREVMEEIRSVFLEMGFKEMKGPWIETAFWNMDAMFIPQDHPARELQDTFYLRFPRNGDLPKDLVERVKRVQENGADTGSLGWRLPWSEEVARRLLLRTHTTAVTYRYFAQGIEVPGKYFCIDRVFRNEAIDRTHLAEFHQVEGFVAAKGLGLRHLMGYLSEFYRRMGIKKLRFKPTYNPYTEPSMEIFAWHPKLGRWVEVGNSGVFRPEALWPYGIKASVIAWGLAVERLAALLYGIEDIRCLIGPGVSLEWIRDHEFRGRF